MVGTALAIGLGLAGLATKTATDIYGAKKASSAAKDAAKIQTDAADKAQRQYDDVFSPYLNAGRTATSTLGRLVSAPPGARFAAPDPTQARQPQPPPDRAIPRRSMGGGARAGMGGDGSMPNDGMPPRMLGRMARPAAPEMVMMEADGETRPVPLDQVARFEQAGARRVS